MAVPFTVSSRMDFGAVGRESFDMKVMSLTIPLGPSCALNPKRLPQTCVQSLLLLS